MTIETLVSVVLASRVYLRMSIGSIGGVRSGVLLPAIRCCSLPL
jgi:hypothetical protein